MDELVNAGIALLDRGVVEEFEAVEPTERQIRQPRADQPDQQIDDDREPDGERDIDFAGGHHGREHEAGYHADQDAEGDERGEDETSHDDPPKTAPKRAESLAIAGQRRCQIHENATGDHFSSARTNWASLSPAASNKISVPSSCAKLLAASSVAKKLVSSWVSPGQPFRVEPSGPILM